MKKDSITPLYDINNSKALFPFSMLYYFLYVVIYSFFFLKTTLIYDLLFESREDIVYTAFKYITPLLFLYSVFTIIFVCKSIKDRVLLGTLLIFSILYLQKRELETPLKTIFITVQLLIGAKNKNGKFLLISTYIIGWLQILLSFVFSIKGIVPFYTWGTRHGFGSIYPTDLACHFLVLALILCIIRDGKLKLYDYLWYLIICIVNLEFMQAKVGLIALILVIGGTFFYQYIVPRMSVPIWAKKALKFFSVISYPFFAFLTLLATYTYVDKDDALINKLDTIRLRLLYGRQAFDNYDITLWGVYIREIGNGGKPAPHPDYFFIDVSYIRLLFFNGILFLLLVIVLYTLSQIVFVKRDKLYICFLLCVFALDCAIEHHIIEIAYGMTIAIWLFVNLPKTKENNRLIIAKEVNLDD